jgi:hypothetical protein
MRIKYTNLLLIVDSKRNSRLGRESRSEVPTAGKGTQRLGLDFPNPNKYLFCKNEQRADLPQIRDRSIKTGQKQGIFLLIVNLKRTLEGI